MTLGSIDYRVTGSSFSRFFRELINERIVYSDLKSSEEKVVMTVPFEYSRRFEKMCRKEGYTFERTRFRGMLRLYDMLLHRSGLIAGAVLSALLISYYSNVILTITIDTDDPEIRGKITDVLKEDGVTTGAYIPDIDLVLEERSLKSKIDEVAWAGITRTGSGIAIDVIESIDAEKGFNVGMPCHLVACEDGVIEDIELLDGQLMKCIGSGVTKGDIVVSGKMVSESSEWTSEGEVITRNTRYVRSIGKIRGSFVRTMVFEQPFDCEVKSLTGEKTDLRYLNIFSADIPLFLGLPDGWYETENEERHFPEINGFMLPFGITEIHLNEFDIRSQLLTEKEAFDRTEKQAKDYEKNFLGEYDMLSKDYKKEVTDSGVKLTATYELYGDICKERDFFIPRNIINDSEDLDEGTDDGE